MEILWYVRLLYHVCLEKQTVEVLKKIAKTLQVGVEYLINDEDGEPKEICIQDQSFANRIRLLDSLDGKDKEAIVHIIDSIVTKKKILHLLTEKVSE